MCKMDVNKSDARPKTLIVVARSVSPWGPHGGLERAVRDQIDSFAQLGWTVKIITPRYGNGPETPGLIDVPWPNLPGPASLSFGPEYLLWVRRASQALLKFWRPGDVVFLHGAAVGVLSMLRSTELSSVSVHNPHGLEEFQKMSIRTFVSRIVMRGMGRRGSRLAAKVVSTDNSITPAVQSFLNIPLEKIVVCPNAVNVDRLVRLSRTEQSSDSEWTICSIGRLVPNKGYDILARALVELQASGMLPLGWRWVHFGSGPEASTVLSILREHNLESRWVHREAVEDRLMYPVVAQSSIFCQPSRHEGSSLVTLEAMALGCVVVATPVGGIPDKIVHKVNGFLATRPTVDSIKVALDLAINADSDVVSAQARKLVMQQFALPVIATKYDKLFVELTQAAFAMKRNPSDRG